MSTLCSQTLLNRAEFRPPCTWEPRRTCRDPMTMSPVSTSHSGSHSPRARPADQANFSCQNVREREREMWDCVAAAEIDEEGRFKFHEESISAAAVPMAPPSFPFPHFVPNPTAAMPGRMCPALNLPNLHQSLSGYSGSVSRSRVSWFPAFITGGRERF